MICGETNISIPTPSSSRRHSCFYTNIAMPGKGRTREDSEEGENKKKAKKLQKKKGGKETLRGPWPIQLQVVKP